MIILNDERFNNEKFYKIKNSDDIFNSNNNSTLIFKFDENDLSLYKFCQNEKIPYGVEVSSIKEFIFIHNLGAKYAFCNELELAKKLQKIADNYLSNTQVIVKASLEEIEKIALLEIDGIFVCREKE